MNGCDHYTFSAAKAETRIAWIFQAWTGIRILTSAMPVLHQLSYQANWKQLVGVEIQEFSLYLNADWNECIWSLQF